MPSDYSHSSPEPMVIPPRPRLHRPHLRKASAAIGESSCTKKTRPDLRCILDQLRAPSAEQVSDARIRDQLRRDFSEDAILAGLAIDEIGAGEHNAIAHPVMACGTLSYEVADGIVILTGAVPHFTIKAWAGLLAWWVPGVREVINDVGLQHKEEEEEPTDKIAEAVGLALAKDPEIDEAHVLVEVQRGTVHLTGRQPRVEQKRKAEAHARCILGVDDVVNEIEVDS